MLKANELRIGNWILFGEKNVQVEFIDPDEDFSVVEPIPLTPYTLEKAGFEKADTKQNDNIELTVYSSKAVDKDIFSIRIDRMKEVQRVLILPVFKTIALPMHLNTVHQLQNLYFALTGNELEINL